MYSSALSEPARVLTQMAAFLPADPAFAERIRSSFGKQGVMRLIDARIVDIEPGLCRISVPFRFDLSQQDGFFHAGITSTVGDSAGGYAGYSLMPEASRVLTVEFKINLLRPAAGSVLIAEGRVIRAGRNLTFTEVTIEVGDGETMKTCASMTQTLACIAA